jgi:hypothetical protein
MLRTLKGPCARFRALATDMSVCRCLTPRGPENGPTASRHPADQMRRTKCERLRDGNNAAQAARRQDCSTDTVAAQQHRMLPNTCAPTPSGADGPAKVVAALRRWGHPPRRGKVWSRTALPVSVFSCSAAKHPQSCWGPAYSAALSSPKLLGDTGVGVSRWGRVKCCGASE